MKILSFLILTLTTLSCGTRLKENFREVADIGTTSHYQRFIVYHGVDSTRTATFIYESEGIVSVKLCLNQEILDPARRNMNDCEGRVIRQSPIAKFRDNLILAGRQYNNKYSTDVTFGNIDEMMKKITNPKKVYRFPLSTRGKLEHDLLREYLTGHTIDTNFIKVKGATYTMGSPKSEDGRYKWENQVEVTITRDFEMMDSEVTQLQWWLVMGYNESYYRKNPAKYCADSWFVINSLKNGKICPNLPVEQIIHKNILSFIEKLNDYQGLYDYDCKGLPSDPKGCYRLPTQAEWELAARAGTKGAFPFPANQLESYAWTYWNSDGVTHDSKEKRPNPWGFYGLYGNVSEFVADVFRKKGVVGGADPIFLGDRRHDKRALKGGSYHMTKTRLYRSAMRNSTNILSGGRSIGFRLVRNL